MIMVSGNLRILNNTAKQFQHTFMITAQGDKWKIVSDCFRIQDALSSTIDKRPKWRKKSANKKTPFRSGFSHRKRTQSSYSFWKISAFAFGFWFVLDFLNEEIDNQLIKIIHTYFSHIFWICEWKLNRWVKKITIKLSIFKKVQDFRMRSLFVGKEFK